MSNEFDSETDFEFEDFDETIESLDDFLVDERDAVLRTAVLSKNNMIAFFAIKVRLKGQRYAVSFPREEHPARVGV